MTALATTTTTTLQTVDDGLRFDETQLAALAFLARYNGRTLDAYRHDLRMFFQWCNDAPSRCWRRSGPTSSCTGARWRTTAWPPLRSTGACRRCAASTGSPTLTAASPPTPPSTSADPRSTLQGHGMDRGELGTFLFTAERFDHDHATLAVLLGLNGLRVSRSLRDQRRGPWLATRPPHPGASSARATSPPPSLWCPGPPAPSTSPWANGTKGPSSAAAMANAWTGALLTGGSVPSANEPASAPSTRTCCAPGSSWPPSMPASPTRRPDRRPSRRSSHHHHLRPPT